MLFLGPPGIGKSTLLRATAHLALPLGFDVIQSRGAASERDLPFAGLHDLIGAALVDRALTLPDLLQRALDVVLLRADPPAGGADALAVNLAVLEVFQALADRSKLLLVLDDVQWLDAPTRLVLEFALRRLPGTRVAVAASSRGPKGAGPVHALEPCTTIEVLPLGEDELADLVELHTGEPPSPPRAAELHQLSGGNPLLALELARSQKLRSWHVVHSPVPERFRTVFGRRLSALSPTARRTLLAAALTSRPTAAVLSAVGGAAGLDEAEASGVLHLKGQAVEFDHPLLASACRDKAGPVAVRHMHSRLGSIAEDPVERARHTALGTVDVDAELANEVENAALLAARRAATADAADLACQALRLTPAEDLESRVRRAVAAASWSLQSGEPSMARPVIDPVLEDLAAGPLRARCLLGLVSAGGFDLSDEFVVLRDVLRQPEVEPDVAVDALIQLAAALAVTGDLDASRREAANATLAATSAGLTDLAAYSSLMEARIDLFLGVPLDRSTAWPSARRGSPLASMYEQPDGTAAWEASWRDGQNEAAALLDGLITSARELGDLASESGLALHRAEVAIRNGQLEEAALWAERSYRLRADGVHDQAQLYIRAHVAAWRGELDQARRLAGRGLIMAVDSADSIFEAQCLLVLGFTEVSAASFEEAARHESRLRDLMARMRWGHPGALRWQGDAVEAFLATGLVEDATHVTAQLWEEADRIGLAGCRAVAARCDGLLHSNGGDLKLAEGSLHESAALMTGLDMPLERARTLLALGVVQRRNRQKAAARATLVEAQEIFSRAGAAAWTGRVDVELQRAAGSHAGQDLTVGERTVAELAAAGQTNREIGARLYMSAKTVESVLTRVYRKLGVRSRTELATHLDPS